MQAEALPLHLFILAHAKSEYSMMLALSGLSSIVERSWAKLSHDQRVSLRSSCVYVCASHALLTQGGMRAHRRWGSFCVPQRVVVLGIAWQGLPSLSVRCPHKTPMSAHTAGLAWRYPPPNDGG